MKIIDAVKLTKLKWLNLFNIKYRGKDGRERSWQIVSRAPEPKCITGQVEPPDAVVIVPYHKTHNRVVVIKEYRVPLGDFEYGFPAGLVEKGETVEQAACRELTEETGLSISRFIKISPPVYTTTGISDESVAMVYVECHGEPSGKFNTASELIEVILVSPEETAALCGNGNLKFDAKTWLVLSHYAATGQLWG